MQKYFRIVKQTSLPKLGDLFTFGKDQSEFRENANLFISQLKSVSVMLIIHELVRSVRLWKVVQVCYN